ncbi:member of major facilitator multidrug-resistance DHA1 sub-family [Phellopilus nigrolimitatus]|nr:member of major facilitator multidrug-resistance DHA1 sub-family [Phellopilus nigrolimitatus]
MDFSIALFLQLAKPLSSQVIYPFVPQLIRETSITNGDETKVGYYVGMMQSIFFATETLTVLHWSRASDRIGRKPVILIGLLCLSLSMYCFGLSHSFWGLVLSRSLNGAFNGNIGVIKSMMAEMTDGTNLAHAFAYQPIPWSTGATFGPLIGGALSCPAECFPGLFGNSDLLKMYPYFLPGAIPAMSSVLAWISSPSAPSSLAGARGLFLQAHSNLTRLLRLRSHRRPHPCAASSRGLLSSPSAHTRFFISSTSRTALYSPSFTPTHARSAGSTSIENALAMLGLSNGIFQAFCFARMIKAWGVRKTYLAGITSAAPIFACFPAMSAVVCIEDLATLQTREEPALSVPLLVMLAFQLALTLPLNTCYGCCFMYTTRRRLRATYPSCPSASYVVLVRSACRQVKRHYSKDRFRILHGSSLGKVQ